MDEWVATTTWLDEAAGLLTEEGGVYTHEPNRWWHRALIPGEEIVECPRCGQRFAECEDEGATAEDCRDKHFDGDEDCPSICAHMPARRLRVVETPATAPSKLLPGA